MASVQILTFVALSFFVCGCNGDDYNSSVTALLMDQCGVRVLNRAALPLAVSIVSHNCYRCLPQPWPAAGANGPNGNVVMAGELTDFFVTDSGFPSTFVFTSLNATAGAIYTSAVLKPRQHGLYTLVVGKLADSDGHTAHVETDDNGDDQYAPLYFAIAVLVALAVAGKLFPWDRAGRMASIACDRAAQVIDGDPPMLQGSISTGDTEALLPTIKPLSGVQAAHSRSDATSTTHTIAKSERLLSLDTFRGATLAGMIFTNYGCAGYTFCVEAAWNGMTLGLLMQPFFMWIMGTSMAFVFSSLVKRGARRHAVLWKILRRFVILFALGLFLNCDNGVYVKTLRIQGVLQRLAISYAVVGLLLWGCAPPETKKARGRFDDLTLHWKEWVFVLLCQVVWVCITYLVDVPGCGRGYLGPGGIGDMGKFQGCTGGAAQYIDIKVFGRNHIYGASPGDAPTCADTYQCGAHDPEGLLGNLTCFLMTYCGVHCGRIIQYWKDPAERVGRFLSWAVLYGCVTLILTGAKKDEGWMPLNANLWTLSFVTCHCCLAFLAFALFYVLVDVTKVWRGMPFRPMGMNSIATYFGHLTLQPYFPFTYLDTAALPSHGPFLWMNLVGVGTLLLANWYADRIGFYIKI